MPVCHRVATIFPESSLLKKTSPLIAFAVISLLGALSFFYFFGKPEPSPIKLPVVNASDLIASAPPSLAEPPALPATEPAVSREKPTSFGRPEMKSLRVIPMRAPFAPRKAAKAIAESIQPVQTLNKVEASSGNDVMVKEIVRLPKGAPPTELSSDLPRELAFPTVSESNQGTTFAFGGGLDLMPRWSGSSKTELRSIPYIDINWRDQVVFSTVKGLIIDVIHGERWHGGLIGTMVWGRSTKDLSGLRVPTLQNTLQGGLYLEYALTSSLTLGGRVRQDIQNTGVSYGEFYVEYELPKIGYLEHDVRFVHEGMNQTGMRRFFGVTSQNSVKLGISAYSPKAGGSKSALTYEGFMPTSESMGIAFAATIGRLGSGAADSPLIKNFGSAVQKEFVAAFVYHF